MGKLILDVNTNFLKGNLGRFVVPKEEIKNALEKRELKIEHFNEGKDEFRTRYYPQCVIDAMKNIEENTVKEQIRRKIIPILTEAKMEYGYPWTIYVFLEEVINTPFRYKIFCYLNCNQVLEKVENGVLEVSVVAELVCCSKRFGQFKFQLILI